MLNTGSTYNNGSGRLVYGEGGSGLSGKAVDAKIASAISKLNLGVATPTNYDITLPPQYSEVDWNLSQNSGGVLAVGNKPSLATVATSGKYTDLTLLPALATVATTGSYTDLSNKPVITGTAPTLFHIKLNSTGWQYAPYFDNRLPSNSNIDTASQPLSYTDVTEECVNPSNLVYTGDFTTFYPPVKGIYQIVYRMFQNTSLQITHTIVINGVSPPRAAFDTDGNVHRTECCLVVYLPIGTTIKFCSINTSGQVASFGDNYVTFTLLQTVP